MKKEPHSLANLPKKHIYTVPDNCFEELENEILSKKNQQPVSFYYDKVLQYVQLAAAAAVILFILSSGITNKKENNDPSSEIAMTAAINDLSVFVVDNTQPN